MLDIRSNARSFAATALSLLTLTALAACGHAPGDDPPTVEGTVGGKTVGAMEAISSVISQDGIEGAVIVIASRTGICADKPLGEFAANAQVLLVTLSVVDLATARAKAPTETGTFQVLSTTTATTPTSTSFATVQYVAIDANSESKDGFIAATAGSIELDSIDGKSFAGSGDVTLSTGDEITFTFDALECAKLRLM